MLRKTINSLLLAGSIALPVDAAASPTVASYLTERSRGAIETATTPWSESMSIRAEGDGFVVDTGLDEFGSSMSIHADNALSVSSIERPAPLASICPQWSMGEFGQEAIALRCEDVAIDMQGTLFYIDTVTDTRVAVARDRERHVDALGFDARLHGVATIAATDGGALSAIATASGQLQLLALDARARTRWQLDVGDFVADGVLRWVRNGNTLLLLRQQGNDLRIDRVDPANGAMTLRLQRTLDAGLRLGAASMDGASNLFLWLFQPESSGLEGSVQRLNADGVVTHAQDVSCLSDSPDAEFPGGIVANCGLSSNGAHTHWYSFEQDGRHLYKAEGDAAPRDAWSDSDDLVALALAADGTSLLGVANADIVSGATGRLVRVGPSVGAVTDPALLSPAPGTTLKPQVFDDGGAGFVVADMDTFYARVLRRFDADGQQLWRAPLQPGRAAVDVSTTQVCAFSGGARVLGMPARVLVDCVGLADGASTLSIQMDNVRDDIAGFAAHTPGRALVLAQDVPSTDNRKRLIEWRSGQEPRTLTSGLLQPLAMLDSQDGALVIEQGVAPMRVDRFDAAGHLLASTSLPASVVTLRDAELDAQDRLWIIYRDADPNSSYLARIDAQGQFAHATQTVAPGGHIARVLSNPFGTLVQIDRAETPGGDGSPDSTLLSLAPDGQLRWQYFARSAWPHFAAIDSSDTRVGVLELTTLPELAWRLTELDSATGAVRANHALPLPSAVHHSIPRTKFADPSRIDFAVDAGSYLSVGSVGISPGAAIGDIASALGGAWAIPGLGGQGLVFEHNPAVGMLSAAWYSHDSARPMDFEHSALHWHTLLGVVPGHETFEMPMSIFENAGGAFDDLPTTASTQVGSATLSVTGCDQMTLRYVFGDDQSTARMIALQRASPRTQPCTLRAPNTSQETTSPPSYIARSDMGGSWYEQRTSGQGVNLVIYPPSSTSAPETIGMGWFTYDAAGAADEHTQQHWFTASGAFDDTTQQRARLTIYRTTGGDRDTTATRNTHRVGEATLERIDCDSATLSYRFDDTLVAGAFAARTRTIPLQRLGGCRP